MFGRRSPQDNKAIVRRTFEESLNRGNLAVVDELFAPSFIDHNPDAGQAPGPAGIKQVVTKFRNGFPDLHVTIEDQVAEGDRVATRLTMRGTHRGEFAGIAPTGKQMTRTVIYIMRLANGQIAENWEEGGPLLEQLR